jgi:small subunit ribosomal protein S8
MPKRRPIHHRRNGRQNERTEYFVFAGLGRRDGWNKWAKTGRSQTVGPTARGQAMWSDPIADMLTRIRNAARAGLREVKIPASRLKVEMAKVLKDEGYVAEFDRIEDSRQGVLRIQLKYDHEGKSVITELKRFSKTGCRDYRGVEDLPRVMNGMGVAIVSTSHGVFSDRECRKRRVGGEVLCTVF